MLTRAELDEVRNILRTHFLAIIQESVGSGELSRDERRILQAAGIIDTSGSLLVDDPYYFGKLVGIFGASIVAPMGVAEVKRAVERLQPMTEVEENALEYARAATGQYIRGVMDMTLRGVTSATVSSAGDALRAIQDATAQNIAERQTISQLRTTLFHLIDNKQRDWNRIAHTEMHEAIQRGVYASIRDNSPRGADQLVFKRPNPDACKYCKGLYLKRDGFTPKIFKMSELAATNMGRRAAEWVPVIGSTHPWCNCQLEMVPEGYDFETRWTIGHDFKEGGIEYRRGRSLTELEYKKLVVAGHEGSLNLDSVLSYTGTTGAPELALSIDSMPIHADDDCVCEML